MNASIAERLGGQETPLTDEQIEAWRAEGYWEQRTLRSLLTDAATESPDRTAVVGYDAEGKNGEMTYAELDVRAHHVASALDSLGVGAGDGVVVMLPNWVEYAALVFGIIEAGGTYSGIPVAYGPQQVEKVVRRSRAKVMFIPRSFRRTEHLEMLRDLRADLPDLQHIIVLDDDPSGLRQGEHLWSDFEATPSRNLDLPDPGRVCYLGFTSGTTGEPKGAMHSHESLLYSVRSQVEHLGIESFGSHPAHLVASPIGHHTGFIWGIMLTAFLKGTGVYVDRWDARWGIDVMRREKTTFFVGAPTFLQDMVRTDLADDPECPLTCLIIAGSPVPRQLPISASKALGAYVAPAWGMTECSIITSCTPTEPDAIQQTDGSVFAGSEVRIMGPDGRELPPGKVGELQIRGPALFLGYYDRPDATEESFVDGLWFRTGDTAELDENGWLSLRGRIKDMVIRGGENIPVTEVESVVFGHPAVLQAAVVGIPDERLGERICVVLKTKDGVRFTVDELSEYLIGQGLSRHYLPEQIVHVEDMPMTPSGKIKKFELREELKSAAGVSHAS